VNDTISIPVDECETLRDIARWSILYSRAFHDGAELASPTMQSARRGLMRSVRDASDEFYEKYDDLK